MKLEGRYAVLKINMERRKQGAVSQKFAKEIQGSREFYYFCVNW